MSSLICRLYWRHPWPAEKHSMPSPFAVCHIKYSYTHLWRVHLAGQTGRKTDRPTVWRWEEQIHWSLCSHCFAHTASSIDSFGLLLTGPAKTYKDVIYLSGSRSVYISSRVSLSFSLCLSVCISYTPRRLAHWKYTLTARGALVSPISCKLILIKRVSISVSYCVLYEINSDSTQLSSHCGGGRSIALKGVSTLSSISSVALLKGVDSWKKDWKR